LFTLRTVDVWRRSVTLGTLLPRGREEIFLRNWMQYFCNQLSYPAGVQKGCVSLFRHFM